MHIAVIVVLIKYFCHLLVSIDPKAIVKLDLNLPRSILTLMLRFCARLAVYRRNAKVDFTDRLKIASLN